MNNPVGGIEYGNYPVDFGIRSHTTDGDDLDEPEERDIEQYDETDDLEEMQEYMEEIIIEDRKIQKKINREI